MRGKKNEKNEKNEHETEASKSPEQAPFLNLCYVYK